MVKITGWITGCFALATLLMACGGSDSPTGPGTGGGSLTEAALIGKWNVTSVHTQGWSTDDAGNKKNVDSVDTFPSGTNTVEYWSNKTDTVNLGGFKIGGTWSIKGDSVITITSLFGFAHTSSAFASVSGNSGTFKTLQVDGQDSLMATSSATKQ